MRDSTLRLTSSILLLAMASACAQAPIAHRRLAAASAATAVPAPNTDLKSVSTMPAVNPVLKRVAQPGDRDFKWPANIDPNTGKPMEGLTNYLLNPHWNNHISEKSTVKRYAKTVAGYGPEMVRFYAAVGAMEASKCLVEKDPTICTSYWASLTEGEQAAVGHVGFMLFMMGAGIPNAALAKFAPKFFYNMTFTHPDLQSLGTKLTGQTLGQVGMMSGLMAQSIATEIYFHPAWQEYKQAIKANPDPKFRAQKRAEMYAKIWADTGGSSKWWKNQAVEGGSMLSAVGASMATQEVLGMVWRASWSLFGKESPTALLGTGLVAMTTEYMASTMLFLGYANIFSDKYHSYFDRRAAINALNKAQDEFEAELKKSGGSPAPQVDPQAPQAPQASKDAELHAIVDRFKSRINRASASVAPASAPSAPAAPSDDDVIPAPTAPAAAAPSADDLDSDAPGAGAPAAAAPGATAAPGSAPDVASLQAMLAGLGGEGAKTDTRTELEKKADALEAAWDGFRATMLSSTQMIQYRHGDYLGKFDEKVMKLYYSYLWVAAGAQKGDKLWNEDQIDWKSGLDVAARINDFFCGSSVETSVVDSADWHGIPIPGKFDPQVKPPRVGSDLSVCVKDLKVPGTPDEIQKMRDDACKQDKRLCTAEDVWSHRLKSFDLGAHARTTYRELLQRKLLVGQAGKGNEKELSKQVDDLFAKVMEATNPVREKIIKRYDLSLQKELLSAMVGRKVKVTQGQAVDFDLAAFKRSIEGAAAGQGRMPMGVLPAYESELTYWKAIAASHPGNAKSIQAHVGHLQEKQKAAEELLKYTLAKPEDRKPPTEDPAADDGAAGSDMGAMMAQANQEPYKVVIQMWKDFVLK